MIKEESKEAVYASVASDQEDKKPLKGKKVNNGLDSASDEDDESDLPEETLFTKQVNPDRSVAYKCGKLVSDQSRRPGILEPVV